MKTKIHSCAKLFALFCVFTLCVTHAWGQGAMTVVAGIGENADNPTAWYYVNLTAGVSNPGNGTTKPGQVWLVNVASAEASADEAYSLWVPNNPRPETPANPYTAEVITDLMNKWNEAHVQGLRDTLARRAQNYPVEESWTDEQKAIAQNGYKRAYRWYKDRNPYSASNISVTGTSNAENGVMIQWNNGCGFGMHDAVRDTTITSGMGYTVWQEREAAWQDGYAAGKLWYNTEDVSESMPTNPYSPSTDKNNWTNWRLGFGSGISDVMAGKEKNATGTTKKKEGYNAAYDWFSEVVNKPENPFANPVYTEALAAQWETGCDAGITDGLAGNENNAPEETVENYGYTAAYTWCTDTRKGYMSTNNATYGNLYSSYDWSERNSSPLGKEWDEYFDYGKTYAKQGYTPEQFAEYIERNASYGASEDSPSYKKYWARKNGGYAAYNWWTNWYNDGHWLNKTNPVGFAETVSLKGSALVYAPGLDMSEMAMYVNMLLGPDVNASPYAYFYGKAQENDGWYLAGWSYTEGKTDLGGSDGTPTLLSVLPSATAGEANLRNEYVYATFQPVMVADYKVNGLINKSVSNSTTIVFDAVGERVSASDFNVSVVHATTGDKDSNWAVEITSCADNKVTVTVTYSGTSNGEFRGDVTLASKSGCSQLTAPVYARVGTGTTNEATLYDGKNPTSTTGTLAEMIAAANGTDKIVVLNKNYTGTALDNLSACVTINLNGNTIQNLTVTGGEVTIAYDKYGSNGEAISVTGGKLILNGGEFTSLTISAGATVEQNGATISGAVTNSGSLTTTEGRFEGGLTSSGSLTIGGGTFEGETAITISGGNATLDKGVISGSTYGVHANGAGSTTTITSKLVSVYGGTNAVKQTSGTVTLSNGRYDGGTAPLAGSVSLQGGYFKVDSGHFGVSVAAGKNVFNVLAGTEYAEGYRYLVGEDASSAGVCRIGRTSYPTLEGALDFANNTGETVTIIMTNDYTLPAGYYTLPATATLIVPMSDEQETGNTIIPRVSNNGSSPVSYVKPYEFRRLTFAKGVNIDVHGTIELTGTQRASDDAYAAMPHGAYGHLVMEDGSHMTLQSGSLLRAWGYMTGKGETDARRGSTVREQFQMGDWKGGQNSFNMLNTEMNTGRVFPITQYFIQNIEAPVKYHPGAILSTTTSVSASLNAMMGMTAMANDIIIVGIGGGAPAMFYMDNEADAENTWVRKWYDAENDVQTYDVNSGAHIGSMLLDLGKLGTNPLVMNSGIFVLPITNNMKIHLLSGSMDFTQTTALLPGAEVEVDKESVVSIVRNTDPDVYSGALYVYDADQWGNYAKGKSDSGTKYTKVVKYSPSWDGSLVPGKPADGKPTKRSETAKPGDASINVHGRFDSGAGAVYTTSGGANIFSSNEDAGTFVFSQDAPTTTSLVYQCNNGTTSYQSTAAVSAKLKNGEGAANPYVETAGSSAYQTFLYMDGEWKGKEDMFLYLDCFTAEMDGVQMALAQSAEDIAAAVSKVYIKPQEYVEIAYSSLSIDLMETSLSLEVTGNADHTYSDAAGAGRLFILTDNCQWWEVEKKDNLYHCIHPDNDTYYYWDDDEDSDTYESWQEQKFSITWKNWDGSIVRTANADGDLQDSYRVPYGTQAEFLGTNPTRDATIDYTYDFIGWNPEPGMVTNDVTYTATYDQKERKYTVIFNNAGGTEIERHFLKHNEVPVCENVPSKAGYTLQWTPALAAVTGDATYTATWLEEPPTEFAITFVDYDGKTVLKNNSVLKDKMPEPPANPKGKPATTEFSYVFDHWSPTVSKATQAITYTAVYREENRTYAIRFEDEDGTEIETKQYAYGQTPVCSETPSKAATAQRSYSFAWVPQIESVMADATYRAVFTPVTNKYTVTVKSNPSGACSISGAGMYEYNSPVTLTLSVNDGYTFIGWSDGQNGTATSRLITVSEDKELVANFTVANPDYTITWKNEDGSADLVTPVGQKTGTATTYTGPTPTKAATAQYSFTFDGWATEANGPKVYKNGMTPKATADVTYYAHFSRTANRYTVTLASSPAGAAILTGAGTYEYGTSVPVSFSYDKTAYIFSGWSDETATETHDNLTVNGDISLTAIFVPKAYTVIWKSEDGTSVLETDENQSYGTATAFNRATPVKPADSRTYVFDGWTTAPDGEGLFYSNGTTPIVTEAATYYAHFATVVSVLEIPVDGSVTLTETTEKNNFVITSNGTDQSGQLIGSDYLTLTGDAYFDLTLNAKNHTWYAIAVPWQVDAENGISVSGRTLTLGKDFDLLFYDGSVRAANGANKSAWKYLEKESGTGNRIMQPGKLYMIGLLRDVPVLRFVKKAGANLLTTTTSVKEYGSGTGSDIDANWNGIANPALFHAYVNAGTAVGQIYNANSSSYTTIDLEHTKLVVGQPVFVQAPDDKDITVAYGGVYAAPRRVAQPDNRYDVRIAPVGEETTDRLFLATDEDKQTDRYVIGKDLAKMGVSTKVAQIWVCNYDAKLCMNTLAPVNDVTLCPLGIYAPDAGEYTISIAGTNADTDLYLTLDGQPVWNLSEGAFTATFEQGTTKRYGLRISAKTPHITTGSVNVQNDHVQCTKILIDNQIYIIRNNKVYTIDGKSIK
ncbi:MAG: InlB B-repeat-containing protein [Paludibacteraceae bacterium]|nr:InlB B-repeat-containing protein [Paludibacteraceae bacterium]